MKILGIETSTFAGSIAIVENKILLGEYTLNTGPRHNEKLIPSIDNLLSDTGIKKEELDAIAVSVGPGSFTSLRVGISTAKALSYALDTDIIGVSSLEIIASNLYCCEYQICPVIDAKKKQLFYGFYRHDGRLTNTVEDGVINPEELCKIINEKTVFLGNGVELYGEMIKGILNDNAVFAPSVFNVGRASNCAVIAGEKKRENESEDCFSLKPKYLRKSEAELKLKKL